MTLRDKKIKHENISGFFEGDKSDTEIISEITKYINLELKDYDALVEAAVAWGEQEWERDEEPTDQELALESAVKPFLPTPKLSDRLDEVKEEIKHCILRPGDMAESWSNILDEIANQLKEQGL